jgi:hypothetical protein
VTMEKILAVKAFEEDIELIIAKIAGEVVD